MCGIVGYVGEKNAQSFLVSGLKRLEYRGYDSAGIVTLNDDGAATLLKAKGKIANLEEKLASNRRVIKSELDIRGGRRMMSLLTLISS